MRPGATKESSKRTGIVYRFTSGAVIVLLAAFAATPAMAEKKLPPSSFTLNIPVKLSRIPDDVKIFVKYQVIIGDEYRGSGEYEVPVKDGEYDGTITVTGKFRQEEGPMGRMRRPGPGGAAAETSGPQPQPYPGRYFCSLETRHVKGTAAKWLAESNPAPGAPYNADVNGDYAW